MTTKTIAIRDHVYTALEKHLKKVKDKTHEPYAKARFVSEAIIEKIERANAELKK